MFDPHCGVDGVTYVSEDHLKCNKMMLDYKGKCIEKKNKDFDCKKKCPTNYDPVCGKNRLTYQNRCTFKCKSN